MIEKAVEEQPSEIYIKREIPFDLDLVGTLLRDVRGCFHLPDEPARGFVEVGPFPELNVKKLDDITSELSVLKSCVTAWTQEANRKGVELQKENKLLKVCCCFLGFFFFFFFFFYICVQLQDFHK